MALSLDRQAFVDILSEGKGNVGGIMQPPPGGLWGMPPDVLQTLPARKVKTPVDTFLMIVYSMPSR